MFLDILFPNRCLRCNTIIDKDEIVCIVCMQHIDFSHYISRRDNALYMKCKSFFPVESADYLMNYHKGSLTQKIIHQLKYKGGERVGKTLALWTLERITFGENLPDVLLSVPLHYKKQKVRGYNQLHLYTETLSKELNIPYDHQLLKRNIHKKAQALQNEANRTQVSNLFSTTKTIKNKHIMLIDDVFTTGNTLSSVVWEILKEPSNKISVLVMALD